MPQLVKEENDPLPDTKNLSGNEAVDVMLPEEVQLAEQPMNKDVVNVALQGEPQLVKEEEKDPLPDTKNLSGNEAVDVALLEEVQLAEQSMNNDAVNVALHEKPQLVKEENKSSARNE